MSSCKSIARTLELCNCAVFSLQEHTLQTADETDVDSLPLSLLSDKTDVAEFEQTDNHPNYRLEMNDDTQL